MKVVLMHGKNTDPSGKWYPWFVQAVHDLGIPCFAPTLPKAEEPYMEEWLTELRATSPNEDTILVGHSRGGVAVLRYLEKLPIEKKVRKVILVATNSGLLGEMAIPAETNYGFYTDEGYDFQKIRSHCNDFVVLHSTDDEWVPFSAGEENAAGLNARFLTFDDRGHFGKGVAEIPELLEEVRSVI